MSPAINVDREVILDLLPLYEAGLASPQTRRLVEQWLREPGGEGRAFARIAADEAEAAAELDALLRVKRLMRRQRWLFGAAIGLTVFCFGIEIRFGDGMPVV